MCADNADFLDLPEDSSNPVDWPWRKRLELVPSLASRLKENENDSEAESLLTSFSQDSKWEVRMAVAENLTGLPEDLFVHLLGKLLQDSNQDVKSSASRVQKDLKVAKSWASDPDAREMDIETMYIQMAQKFGTPAAKRAREIAGQQMTLLVGPVVHDIKNEITKIWNSAKEIATLDNGEMAVDEVKSEAAGIMTSAQTTLRMVTALLDYSRPMKLNPAEESLLDILNKCIGGIGARTSRMGNPVMFCVDVDPTLTVWADRDPAERLMTNLLKNAAESFSHPKCSQEEPVVRISAEKDPIGDEVIILISDNGHGMREEDLEKVRKFLPIRSNKPEGTGFGLASAGQIAFAHRGSIHMESDHGKGTKVTVKLPNKKQE